MRLSSEKAAQVAVARCRVQEIRASREKRARYGEPVLGEATRAQGRMLVLICDRDRVGTGHSPNSPRRWVVLIRYRRMIRLKQPAASQRSHGRLRCARTPDERDADGRVVN